MTNTCTECGAINKAHDYRCSFCDASFSSVNSAKQSRAPAATGTPAPGKFDFEEDWKREIERRVGAYRTRRKRLPSDSNQAALPFDPSVEPMGVGGGAATNSERETLYRNSRRNPRTSARSSQPTFDTAAAIDDPSEAVEEFAFAIGIGPRPHADRECRDGRGSYRVEIDLTRPPPRPSDAVAGNRKIETQSQRPAGSGVGSPYFPLASLEERCLAGCIDAILLLFAYGGFLTLFGSLGGHFSFSKFTAVVYVVTLALFYVQYFALFTVFGGVTPGMMLRHLELVNFDGEIPTPRQLLQRSFGYMVSGATFLLGFLWALWDEDRLTWQDRISNTYLTNAAALLHAEPLEGVDIAGAAQK